MDGKSGSTEGAGPWGFIATLSLDVQIERMPRGAASWLYWFTLTQNFVNWTELPPLQISKPAKMTERYMSFVTR